VTADAAPGRGATSALLARVRARLLDREGIAMVLGLVDRRDGDDRAVGAREPAVREDGADLAAALETVFEDLGAEDWPRNEAGLVEALAVLAEDRVKAPVPGTPHHPVRSRPPSVEVARRRAAVVATGGGRGVPDARSTVEALRAGSFLRVVNWHNTPESQRAELRWELSWYVERFDPVRPEDLDRFTDTGRWHRERPGFVPAFYDGYRTHATVAAGVCDDLGITGWFYPPTGFLEVPAGRQRDWAAAHDVDLLAEDLDHPPVAMTLDQLAEISERHVVAAHTATHATLDSCVGPDDVEREVLAPARLLEAVTGRRPAVMAWKLGAPFDPDTPGGRAMIAAGVRYAVSNTGVQRIG
jgi:hypothetical protein